MKTAVHFGLIGRLVLGMLVLIFLASCNDDDETFAPNLIFATDSLSVSNGSSEQTLDVLTNYPWKVESDVDWITFEKDSGDKGRFDLLFSISENDDDERTGIITIRIGQDISKVLTIIQEAGNLNDIYVTLNGAGEGFKWSEATNLENALKIATSGNIIHIAEGTYMASTTITGGDSADEGDYTFEINKNITLQGGYAADATKGATPEPSKYTTLLSGNGKSYHVVTVSAAKAAGQKVVLAGLTISDGNASSEDTSAEIDGTAYRRDYGGGISIGNSVVDILDTKIIDNKSRKFVAGLYAFGDAEVNLERCSVNNNISDGNVGGIWIREAKANIRNSEIIGNEAGGTAAGVHGYPDAEIYMSNSVITDNKGTSFGAAFYVRENSKGVLVNCLISGNSSTSKSGGGGVMMYSDNEVTLISTTITGNNIEGPGGGVYRRKGVNSLKIYNSIISGNLQKDDGPDVDVYESDAAAPLVQASVLSNKTYAANGSELPDAVFNPATMLKKFDAYVIRPIGADNPAILFGMSTAQLMELGATINTVIDNSVITSDLMQEERESQNTMGAFNKGE